MSAYREFTGKTVEEALRNAREAFGAGLEDLDFEILTPGSRGVLGMGAEPARIVAAPRSELGGAAPKREAAEARPLPPAPPREERPRFGDRDRGPRRDDRGRGFGDRDRGDRGPRRDDRGERDRGPVITAGRPSGGIGDRGPRPERGPARPDRGDRPDRADRGPRPDDRGSRGERSSDLTASEAAEVTAARGSLAAERADLEAVRSEERSP